MCEQKYTTFRVIQSVIMRNVGIKHDMSSVRRWRQKMSGGSFEQHHDIPVRQIDPLPLDAEADYLVDKTAGVGVGADLHADTD